MAGQFPRDARDPIAKRLTALGLEFPLWVFDVDEPAWPRKDRDLLTGARPSALEGWYIWCWEYGTDIRKIDDLIPPGVIDNSQLPLKHVGHAQQILERIRYDDGYPPDAFRVIYKSAAGQTDVQSKPLDSWIFEVDAPGYAPPNSVTRIERIYDEVPYWDAERRINLFHKGDSSIYRMFGVATRVNTVGELLQAVGGPKNVEALSIRKAEFQFMDGDQEWAKGVVFPVRSHREHGLSLRAGPQSLHNRSLLSATLLEGVDWAEVENYIFRRRSWPLIKKNNLDNT